MEQRIVLTDLNVIAWLLQNNEIPIIETNEKGRVIFLFDNDDGVIRLLSSYHTTKVLITDYVEAQRKARSLLLQAKGRERQ
jgi:hypothetical protein